MSVSTCVNQPPGLLAVFTFFNAISTAFAVRRPCSLATDRRRLLLAIRAFTRRLPNNGRRRSSALRHVTVGGDLQRRNDGVEYVCVDEHVSCMCGGCTWSLHYGNTSARRIQYRRLYTIISIPVKTRYTSVSAFMYEVRSGYPCRVVSSLLENLLRLERGTAGPMKNRVLRQRPAWRLNITRIMIVSFARVTAFGNINFVLTVLNLRKTSYFFYLRQLTFNTRYRSLSSAFFR